MTMFKAHGTFVFLICLVLVGQTECMLSISSFYFSTHCCCHCFEYYPRFATVLFYLNDDLSGGETSFPRLVSLIDMPFWWCGHKFMFFLWYIYLFSFSIFSLFRRILVCWISFRCSEFNDSWQNGETFHELKVKPEVGKAILFYNQLPDGNMDDFSQHGAFFFHSFILVMCMCVYFPSSAWLIASPSRKKNPLLFPVAFLCF